jgi:ferrochelatase
MRLENIIALTHAKLVNEPCVNIFENIIFDAQKVKRGDLFIAYDKTDIHIAIQNGAYGIVFEQDTQILDDEIAWIRIQNLDEAIKRLLRFKMLQKEVVVYQCNEIVLKLALQIQTQVNFVVVHGDVKNIFTPLWFIENRAIILFCPTLSDKDIFANSKTISSTPLEKIEIIEKTLFETSFIYSNIFYERQLISPLFIPYLEELFHLLKTLKIQYTLKKFIPIEHFEAVFINKNFELKNFGTSDKVLIFEKKSALIDNEIVFLRTNASWAKIIIIIPNHISTKDSQNVFHYNNDKEIFEILKANTFHFALIFGVDKSILEENNLKPVQLVLDF